MVNDKCSCARTEPGTGVFSTHCIAPLIRGPSVIWSDGRHAIDAGIDTDFPFIG